MARFSQIDLVVGNLDQAVAFYRRLGLHVPEDGVWRTQSGAHHATAADGGGPIGLEFVSRRLAQACDWGFAAERGRVVVNVELESREAVDRMWTELLSEGCQGLQAPYDAFWGARYAVVEDPDGNPVGLTSPADAARPSGPPDI
jgi:catechol 2,3-dioxygenase-like lactoylglutathione lyase family enzyme